MFKKIIHSLCPRLFNGLNLFSWLIIIAFLSGNFVMEYFSPHVLWEGFFISFPIIMAFIYWGEKKAYLMKISDAQLTTKDAFERNLFVISYSIILGAFFSLLFQYDNSDMRGWWPLFIYVMSFYGLVFAIFFSLIALLLDRHKTYLIFYSLLIFTIFAISKFWPYYFYIKFLGDINSLSVIYFALIVIHLLYCSIYKLCTKQF